MHPYATDSNERQRLPLYMAILSILLAWLLNRGMEAAHLSLPWWIDAPSVVTFYGIVYFTFDRRLWVLALTRKLGLVKVPDLNGTWVGCIYPSDNENASEHGATLEITQSWRRICVRLRTAHSRSHSLIGAIIVEGAEDKALNYEYINEPNAHAAETMHMHRGTARLRLIEDGEILEGEYYTGRDRKSHGTLRVKRQPAQKKSS